MTVGSRRSTASVTVLPELARGRECSFGVHRPRRRRDRPAGRRGARPQGRRLRPDRAARLPALAGRPDRRHRTSPTRRCSPAAPAATACRSGPTWPTTRASGSRSAIRDDVRVFGDERGVVTLSRGLAGPPGAEHRGRAGGSGPRVGALAAGGRAEPGARRRTRVRGGVPGQRPVAADVPGGRLHPDRLRDGHPPGARQIVTVMAPATRSELWVPATPTFDGRWRKPGQAVEAVAAVDQPQPQRFGAATR